MLLRAQDALGVVVANVLKRRMDQELRLEDARAAASAVQEPLPASDDSDSDADTTPAVRISNRKLKNDRVTKQQRRKRARHAYELSTHAAAKAERKFHDDVDRCAVACVVVSMAVRQRACLHCCRVRSINKEVVAAEAEAAQAREAKALLIAQNEQEKLEALAMPCVLPPAFAAPPRTCSFLSSPGCCRVISQSFARCVVIRGLVRQSALP
jgi:hypothetical protein